MREEKRRVISRPEGRVNSGLRVGGRRFFQDLREERSQLVKIRRMTRSER